MHLLAGLFPFVKIDGLDFDPFIRGWLMIRPVREPVFVALSR